MERVLLIRARMNYKDKTKSICRNRQMLFLYKDIMCN